MLFIFSEFFRLSVEQGFHIIRDHFIIIEESEVKYFGMK